jgi:hypothetical protein
VYLNYSFQFIFFWAGLPHVPLPDLYVNPQIMPFDFAFSLCFVYLYALLCDVTDLGIS